MREIYVDSRKRNEPYGNAYTVFIQSPLKNITQVDLVSATIPNTIYNITDGTDIFTVNSNNYSISSGFYSSKGLYKTVNAICKEMNMSMFENEGKYIFLSTSPFTLTLNSNEFVNITGFTHGVNNSLYATTSNGIFDSCLNGYYFVKSSNVMNLKTYGEYVFLDIEELRRPFELEAVNDPLSSENSSYFAVIPLDVPSCSIKTFKEYTDYKISVEYPKPIDQIDRLTIRWIDSSGTSVNFNGVDENSLILRFHMSEPPKVVFEKIEEQTRSLVDQVIIKSPVQSVFVILMFCFIFILFIKRR